MLNNYSITEYKNSYISLKREPKLISEKDSSITSLALDNEGKYIASGSYDGSIRILAPFSGNEKLSLKSENKISPVTCLRWKPIPDSDRASNILCAIRSNGVIEHWDTRANKLLHEELYHKELKTSL